MSDLNKLNEELTQAGLEEIVDVDKVPERTAYITHRDQNNWSDKEWVKSLYILREEYLLVFHSFVELRYPYLMYERGEDKVYWMYNPSTGIYDELTSSTVRGLIIHLLDQEGLRFKTVEAFTRDCLARYRAIFPEKGILYDDFDCTDDWFHARNGWVNIKTMEFEYHTPDRLSRRKSAVDYDKDAICPTYDAFLDTDIQVPADCVRVMDQFSGLLLTNDIRQQKMLTIIGRPGSGKSTLLNAWRYILGDLATQKRLSDLSGDSFRFAGSSLIGKTLCWFDEVDVKRTEMNNSLGTLITGETINIERKGINGIISAKNSAKCVLTANNLPMSSEHGMYRRIILIYFPRSFYDEGIHKKTLGDSLRDEGSGILNRMIRGLHDLRSEQGFSVIDGHENAIEDYKTKSDTIAEFLDTYFEPDKDGSVSTTDLLASYKNFVGDIRMTLTPQRFGQLLGGQPLTRFRDIQSKKGSKGVRLWQGLRLQKQYRFNEFGLVVEVLDDTF